MESIRGCGSDDAVTDGGHQICSVFPILGQHPSIVDPSLEAGPVQRIGRLGWLLNTI
jgi:hypothetical protein